MRLAIACPALPLCGLAVSEAERYMPTMVERMSRLLHAMDLGGEEPDLAPTERDAFVPPGGDRFALSTAGNVRLAVLTMLTCDVYGNPIVSGGASWMTGSPRSSARQYRPAS